MRRGSSRFRASCTGALRRETSSSAKKYRDRSPRAAVPGDHRAPPSASLLLRRGHRQNRRPRELPEKIVADHHAAVAEVECVHGIALALLTDEDDALSFPVVSQLNEGVLQPAPASLELEVLRQRVEPFGWKLLERARPRR